MAIDLEYLIAVGRGGENGVMSLLKTPEDHAQWEKNIRWFFEAFQEEQKEIIKNAARYDAIANAILSEDDSFVDAMVDDYPDEDRMPTREEFNAAVDKQIAAKESKS